MTRTLLTLCLFTAACTSEPEDADPQATAWGYHADAAPYGKTMGEWSADWWIWLYENPFSDAAVVDEAGVNCANYQPSTDVFFLAGTFGGAAERDCTVPAGRAVLIPIINLSVDNAAVDEADWLSDADLEAAATAANANVTAMHVTVDGVALDTTNLEVDTTAFAYTLPATDNLYQFFGVEFVGTVDPSYSAGFYAMLAPVEAGEHEVHWDATSVSGDNVFNVDVTYHLTAE